MAKMKAVQPEMMRLKELHKEDKVKLQQEMMALYRKEKITSLRMFAYFDPDTFFSLFIKCYLYL